MNESDLVLRIKKMALRIIKLVDSLPKKTSAQVIGKQILRSATSVPANYRSACKAKSKRDFVYKLGIVEEEADETQLWLEILIESGIVDEKKVSELYKEVSEIIAIIVSSRITARKNLNKDNRKSQFEN
jgi:four helix bundle protein